MTQPLISSLICLTQSLTPRLALPALVALCLLAGAPSPARSQHTPLDGDNPFGVVEGFWFPELTCELGVSWERIIFDWGQHQPTSPEDWNTLNVDDRWLKAANDCNREVVAIVKNTPAWATDGLPGPGVPRGLDLPLDDPGNLWAGFMRLLVDYYSGRGVHRFIILNEPDIPAGTYGFEFEGELEDYFLMLKTAYLVAKEVNPSSMIHLAGTTYWHDVTAGRRLYTDRLLERIAQDPDAARHGYYFDVLSLHIYFRTETVPQIVGVMRDLLERHGMGDKAIWINETNASPNRDPGWPVERPQYQVTLEQQSAFIMQATALALASGVERVAVYKLLDQGLPPGAESFGILSPAEGHAPRPAFRTWQAVIAHFSGAHRAALVATDTLDVVRLVHHDGRQTTVTWARTDRPAVVEIGATGDKAYLIDQYGNRQVIRPVEGVYRLHLPPATCDDRDGCAVGGPVAVVVQPDGDSAVVEVTGGRRAPLELALR